MHKISQDAHPSSIFYQKSSSTIQMSPHALRLSYKLDKLHSSLWMPDVFVVFSITRVTTLATAGRFQILSQLLYSGTMKQTITDPALLYLWEFNIIVFFPVLYRIDSIILNEYLLLDQDMRCHPSLCIGYWISLFNLGNGIFPACSVPSPGS